MGKSNKFKNKVPPHTHATAQGKYPSFHVQNYWEYQLKASTWSTEVTATFRAFLGRTHHSRIQVLLL